jgi:predicted MFS family arabinose efflux permease
VPDEDRGKAFGLLTSANAFGWALGPAVGGYVGAELGFRTAFFVTAALFLGVTAWVWRTVRQVPLDEPAIGQVRPLWWRHARPEATDGQE